MANCTVTVDPGVCRMNTVIVAKPSDDMTTVEFEVRSECSYVTKLAEGLGAVSPYEAMGVPLVESPIYAATSGIIPHVACPVPCAMTKAMEAAADLGLKRNVTIRIERDSLCTYRRRRICRAMNADIVHIPESNRFEAVLSGRCVGHLTYVVKDGTMNVDHTFVEPEFRSQGIGSRMVDEATAFGRANGWRVASACSYAAAREGGPFTAPSRRSAERSPADRCSRNSWTRSGMPRPVGHVPGCEAGPSREGGSGFPATAQANVPRRNSAPCSSSDGGPAPWPIPRWHEGMARKI